MAGRHRSRTRLVVDILRALRDEPQPTVNRLLLIANLSHVRLKEYMDHIVAKGWAQEVQTPQRRSWELTAVGQAVLTELERIDDRMEDFGLGF